MLNILKYSHLSAKISGMKGKMLTENDYLAMMSKKNVSEVASYLKNETYYADAFQTLNDKDVHRDYLEVMLVRAEISDALRIAKYLRGDDKKIYRYVYRKQEIEDLKNMLRTLQMGRSLSEIDRKTLFISKYSKIDFNESLKAKTIVELIDTVRGTKFYGILKPLILEENKIDLFSAEMSLDMYYFDRLLLQLKATKSDQEREIFKTLIGAQADIKNILWIYRGKKYYDINKELLYRYLIPLSYKLRKDDLAKMLEAKDEDEVTEWVLETKYKNILGKWPRHWEHDFFKYLAKVESKIVRRFPHSLAPVVGYIILKELEISNIIAIIEGIRYQVASEDIRSQLIGRSL